jgi:hypothetical protein
MTIEITENTTQTLTPPSTALRPIEELNDRELLEEIALSMRTVGAALTQLQQVGPMGLMKMMMSGK